MKVLNSKACYERATSRSNLAHRSEGSKKCTFVTDGTDGKQSLGFSL